MLKAASIFSPIAKMKRTAFTTWLSESTRLDAMQYCLMCMLHRRWLSGFNTWVHNHTWWNKHFTAVSRRVLPLTFGTCFRRWKKVRTQRFNLRRALASLVNRRRIAWNTWQAAVARQHALRGAVISLLKLSLRRAMNSWVV